jgi:hypothetical protein
MRKKKNERKRGRKVHAQISIAKKTAKKKNDGSSLTYIIYIYTMQWCYVDREELGASTTLFFSLLSLLCCWGSGVFDT